jgi:DNA-binding transcriptional MerR regulator
MVDTMDLKQFLGSMKIHDPQLFKQLMEPRFNAKIFENQITYRTINYWDEKGYLLLERDENDKEWRKLSFTDYIWIRMLDDLRQMGIAVEGIVKALFRELGISGQEVMEMPDEDYEKLKALPFERLLPRIDKNLVGTRFCILLVNIVSFKTQLAIRIFKNGEYSEQYSNPQWHGIVIEEMEKRAAEKRKLDDLRAFISISLSDLITDFIETKDLNNISDLNILSSEETELFKHIRNKDLREITIKLAEGKPISLDLTEVDYNADIQKRIYEDMMGSGYVECTYTTNSKKQVTFKRTTKIKLDV